MKILLDTCALIWLVSDPSQLSATASALIEENADEIFVSTISAFEVALLEKQQRIKLPTPMPQWFAKTIFDGPLQETPLTSEIATLAVSLPDIHQDPCDRLLIATAIHGEFLFLTPDKTVWWYPELEVTW